MHMVAVYYLPSSSLPVLGSRFGRQDDEKEFPTIASKAKKFPKRDDNKEYKFNQ